MSGNDDVLSGALEYAARGWLVFPIPPGMKKSHKSAAFSGGRPWGATKDLGEIVRDWKRWPGANVGIVCGPLSGMFVIEADTDDGHGIDGIGHLARLIEEFGPLPHTLEALSPSGSRHLYFRWPDGGNVANSASHIAPGVDVRGDGGMVVGVPSIKPGASNRYRWINPPPLFDLAACPEWLLDKARKPSAANVVPIRPGVRSGKRGEAWALAALKAELDALAAAAPGRRNQTLNTAAFKLGQIVAAGALTEGYLTERLQVAAAGVGLAPDEIASTIASGLAAGRGSPRHPSREAVSAQASGGLKVNRNGDTKSSDGAGGIRDTDWSAPTEDAVAQTFTAQYREKLRFDHDAGRWFAWTDDRWQQDATRRAFSYCRQVARRASERMDWSTLKGVRKASFARGVEQFAQSDQAHAVTQECWDRDPMLLGVPGGIIDLRTGELLPPDPAAGITRQTRAKPDGQARCPRWHAFLMEASGGDPEMIRFLQQWCGYCLTGLTREHALAFIFGPGKNGKSVFLNTVSGLLGDYAVTASMDTFTASRSDKHPTDLAMLKGARLVTASETEEGRAWAESRIKQMTGGDPITARFMRQDFFTFQPQFKLTIVGNHKPAIANVDDAMRRRFNIVPFTVKPATPDPLLEEKLREEFPGILRWMIDGCLDWQADGLMPPSSVSAATADYFNEQDLFGQWLTEECHVEMGNLSRWETSSKLFESWSDYARRSGELPGTQTRLGERLRRRGFTKIDRKVYGTTKKVWQGLELSGQVTDGRDAEN